MYFAIVKGSERRAGRCYIVAVMARQSGDSAAVLVCKNIQHAFKAQGVARVNAPDTSFSDGAGNHHAIGQVRHVVFGGVFCAASNLGWSVNAAQWLSGVPGDHECSPFALPVSGPEPWRAGPARS